MKTREMTPEELRARDEDPEFHKVFARASARARGIEVEQGRRAGEIRTEDEFAAAMERIIDRAQPRRSRAA